MYIHLRNLIVFYLNDVHPLKEVSFVWMMYIHLRNVIVSLGDLFWSFKKETIGVYELLDNARI